MLSKIEARERKQIIARIGVTCNACQAQITFFVLLIIACLILRFLQEENGPDVVVGYAMEKIYDTDIMLSESMLLDSVSNLGNLEAVRRFVAKLVTGMASKLNPQYPSISRLSRLGIAS